jgi:hypothetical protein
VIIVSDMLIPSMPLTALDPIPETISDAPQWADYIELLCLVNPDRRVSKGDIVDRVAPRARDLGEVHSTMDDQDPDDVTGHQTDPGVSDKWTRRVGAWFENLRYREGAFSEGYPFLVSDRGNVLKTKESLTFEHKLYIFLLLSSNLRYITPEQRNLTSSFEDLCCAGLKGCMPPNAEVHLFGTNPMNKGRYTGSLWKKIELLAGDINTVVHISEDNFPANDTGDNGLDVVGWVPPPDGDKADGLIMMFAQCACSPNEWSKKQHSSSVDAWRPIMKLNAAPTNVIFIPFCFRNATGGWHREQDIHGSVVVDRHRLIHLLRPNIQVFEQHECYNIVERMLAQRETIS